MPARAVVRTALTGVLAGLLTVVCSCAADPTAPAPTSSATPPTSPAAPNGSLPPAGPRPDDSGGGPGTDSGRHGRGGGAGGGVAALPADFPRDVPLPPGTLQATSGAAGQWSALLLVPGSAAEALRSAMGFYVANGFTADSPSTAHRGGYTITVVTENRDHSSTSTNLAVGVAAH